MPPYFLSFACGVTHMDKYSYRNRIWVFCLVAGLLSGCVSQVEKPGQKSTPNTVNTAPGEQAEVGSGRPAVRSKSEEPELKSSMSVKDSPSSRKTPRAMQPMTADAKRVPVESGRVVPAKPDSIPAQAPRMSASNQSTATTRSEPVPPPVRVVKAKLPSKPKNGVASASSRALLSNSSSSSSMPASISTETKTPIQPDTAASPTVVDIEFTLEQLPITIGKQWRLRSAIDHCVLESMIVEMDDGQGLSKIHLDLAHDIWTLVTESDIDLSYAGTGLDTDKGQHFELGEVVNGTNVVFTEDSPAITAALLNTSQLRIALGFWPTWPITETKFHELPTTQFTSAYRAWQKCQLRINAR